MTKRYTYGVDEGGKALGEAHANAKLSDEDVEHIRDLYDTGMVSYRTLALLYSVNRITIRDICQFRRRSTTPTAYRTRRTPTPKILPPREPIMLKPMVTLDDEMYETDLDVPIQGREAVAELLGISEFHAHGIINEQDF